MQTKPTSVFAAIMMVGVLSATTPTKEKEKAGPGDIGSEEWFKSMRTADGNSAMLKALPGSNGQPVVPQDCVEISAVLNVGGNPHFKGRLPHLRIVSNDDRVDNVPRSPYIYQPPNEAPHFYTVLKRDLTYEFYWLDGMREDRIAVWRVPPGAAKQLRVTLAIDARGSAKIAVAGGSR